jgi:glycosyltransferase involved in cell wall biosynthesis
MRLVTSVSIYLGGVGNHIHTVACRPHSILFYVVEQKEWSIKWDGQYITRNLNRQGLIKARIATTWRGIHNQIIHFGSRATFLPEIWKGVDSSNKIIFTWFHGTEEDKDPSNLAMIEALPEASRKADVVHTSCLLSKDKLIRWGVPEEKIVVVPLGVELDIFKPVSKAQKMIIRKELGLPQDKLIIGSFQKDGIGWGEGLEPKWVKGPDIFLRTIEKLSSQYDILVLLTGPARGYVKRELDRIDIPYKHHYLNKYMEIPRYYNALDLYLVTSRAEGGPKAILESMATGVPLVSTEVGMAPDIIKDGYNGLLAKIDEVETLSEKAAKVLGDKHFGKWLTTNALNTIEDFSWEKITREYHEKIYSRFTNM